MQHEIKKFEFMKNIDEKEILNKELNRREDGKIGR